MEEDGRQSWEAGPNRKISLAPSLPPSVRAALATKQQNAATAAAAGGAAAAVPIAAPSSKPGIKEGWAFSHVGGYMAARDAGIDADGYVAVVRGCLAQMHLCGKLRKGLEATWRHVMQALMQMVMWSWCVVALSCIYASLSDK